MAPPSSTRLLFGYHTPGRLGSLRVAGAIKNSAGVGPVPRVLGEYALVYLVQGGGSFAQAGNSPHSVRAGHLLVVFPEIAHTYGPPEGQSWSEYYLVFGGPLADLWRREGLLSPDRPVWELLPVDYWRERFEELLRRAGSSRLFSSEQDMSALQSLLTDARQGEASRGEDRWLEHAKRLLGMLEFPLDLQAVARECGLGYENFRKKFLRATGVSPARFHGEKMAGAACQLLFVSDLTIKEIAARLAFRDEFHFSRRFKELTGSSPQRYRQNLPRTTYPLADQPR